MTQPLDLDPKLTEAMERPTTLPPLEKVDPLTWIRIRLFNTWYNSLITIVLSVVSAVLGYLVLRFVFVTGQWEVIDQNIRLFMVGQFPKDEIWRLAAQAIVLAGAAGLALGNIGATRRDQARESGLVLARTPLHAYGTSFWAAGLFLVIVLSFTQTLGPTLVAAAAAGAAIIGWAITARLPVRLRGLGWTLAALAVVIQFQLLSGTGGLAWLFATAALLPLLSSIVTIVAERTPQIVMWVLIGVAVAIGAGGLFLGNRTFGIFAAVLAGLAVTSQATGNRSDALRSVALIGAGLAVFQINAAIDHGGIEWKNWGGLHINLTAVCVVVLVAFPLGMVLALARRSQLPAVRTMAIGYIEFFRGVPLLTLLFAGQFFIGFFINTSSPLSIVTRSLAAFTLFASAYIAEIIRGGLQSIPPGQVEAGVASGLSRVTVMRLIVMPQALRVVIPPMVGQFISLFMDTTLLSLVGIPDFLQVRAIVHAGVDFRSSAHAESLLFIALGFWALGYTMSREAHRLEHRLGVGHR